jgi:hypothetical protein
MAGVDSIDPTSSPHSSIAVQKSVKREQRKTKLVVDREKKLMISDHVCPL